tara:strand:- start:13257 stop:14108 length:852 start_codon:yes stop_codon:yes gene_type:complete
MNAPSNTLNLYLNDIGNHDLLTKAEEVELAEQIRLGKEASEKMEAGEYLDLQDLKRLERLTKKGLHAKEHFILSNLRLVVSVAKKYPVPNSLSLEDLIQEGNIGLEHAVEKFDGRKGFKFSTYGTFWIRQSINRLIDQHSNLIRIPADTHSALRRKLREADVASPELSQEMRRINALTRVTSLDVPIDNDGSKDLHTVVASLDPTPDDLVNEWHNQELVTRALNKMKPKVREMVRYRFGLDDGIEKTFREIGDLVGVSAESARRAVSKALASIAADKSLDPAS